MRILSFFIFIFSFTASFAQPPHLKEQPSGSQSSLRGLSAVSDKIVWASGTEGQFLRTTDGGKNWQKGTVTGADSLDFRDIQAFSATEAVVASAGQPARIYHTTDAGKSWKMVYDDKTGQAFFDALAFWNNEEGMAMSDPVNGYFLLLKTEDGGKSWKKIEKKKLPPALEGEAGFAASGTGLVTIAPDVALFGTGGPAVRVFRSATGGESWEAYTTPMEAATPSTGIYSMAFKDSLHGIALGGDYTQPNATTNHLLLSSDGGKSWQRVDHSGLRGYRSGVAFVPGSTNTYIAAGTNGIDISYDGGKSWSPLSDTGMHAISFSTSGRNGWASGAKGKIIKFIFN
ncbi:WD40/YVTN/BNR-like repeat-containing protein [Nafulsella turpanensis]|uniref:WD40/YVTN/BNR-like repeat-containing protein n=1 Tax=Nafulsella turpanensis TaxID=1265690 RepID=UPI00034A792A|nr:YCF48-related protein [Nafulsella turpanensis]